MQKTIFLVEDEDTLAAALKLNLELEKYIVETASDGKKALEYFKNNHNNIQLVLLDVMLPNINGFDLCAEFKKISAEIPVIFLTAKNVSADKISGLKLGAEDYITKPFELEELLLRIKNVLKRNAPLTTNNFQFGNCEINFDTFEIKDIHGNKNTLSRREIGLLRLLTTNVNKVISRDVIISNLWEVEENASSRTIDNFILGFRKHFESNPKEPVHFLSIRGVGYKFVN